MQIPILQCPRCRRVIYLLKERLNPFPQLTCSAFTVPWFFLEV